MTTVYTTGYEQHLQPESLIESLRRAGVERVVDVRELPLSRRRGFSKTALGEALEEAGIRYEHERPLGNPRALRELYRSGRAKEGARRYREHLLGPTRESLAALAQSLAGPVTCLLCLEAEPERCHRALIVEALEERLHHLRVVHLR
jgi:uncharacterized protein (DUF488 family)